jgi:hypothetical protein
MNALINQSVELSLAPVKMWFQYESPCFGSVFLLSLAVLLKNAAFMINADKDGRHAMIAADKFN